MASRNETNTSGEAAAEPGPSTSAAAKKPTVAKRAAATKSAATKSTATKSTATKSTATKSTATKSTGTSTPRRRTAKARGIEAIRRHLRDLDAAPFFVGATPFHLLGLERWVPSLRYVTYFDPWDGANPRVLTPERTGDEPASPAALTNHLLQHPQVWAHLAEAGRPVKIIAVAYDAETERLCAERGYDLLMPDVVLRERLEPAPRQPIESVNPWPGDPWPVEPAPARPRLVTVSAVSATPGTIVGPISGVVGHQVELSPIADDWCGSDVLPGTLRPESRAAVTALVRAEGDRLAEQGYHGYFEVDLVLDPETDAIAVCALRLRIGGVASITNLVAGAHADLPLLAFHLLEQLGVGYDLDVADLNRRWVDLAAVDGWSQLIIKACEPQSAEIVEAPPTGRWSTGAQAPGFPTTVLGLDGPAFDALDLVDDAEFFFLRIDGPGDLTWPGADLGIVMTRGPLRAESGTLTPRAQLIIDALRWRYVAVPPGELGVSTIAV